MRMARRIAALLALCLPLLAGCDVLDGLVERTIDTSVLYVGSYPVVQDMVSGEVYSQFLYVDFLSRGEEHSDLDYDLEINLASGTLDDSFSSTVDGLGNRAAFYDVGKDAVRGTAYSTIGDFFDAGGSVVCFLSAGRVGSRDAFVSGDVQLTRAGCVVAFSGVSVPGEVPAFSVANVYRETLGGLFR